jgi:hypothetical protein
MSNAISIHIGLNHVDTAHYTAEGWEVPVLAGCLNDANAMKAIAVSRGYQPTMLTESNATAAKVIAAIAQAAKNLTSGDHLLLTYSGHGAQIPDVNGDESDGMDETWVLYDRMLIDDELYCLWSQFKSGVRIFMLSDSCHSGTVARIAIYTKTRSVQKPDVPRVMRALPQPIANAAYAAHKEMYDTAQYLAGPASRAVISASVILISGCLDNQESQDGTSNGLFTENLLKIWNNGTFSKNHEIFSRQIIQQMPPDQTPNYYKVGATDKAFEDERPFTPGSSAPSATTTASKPSVTGPEEMKASDPAPEFQVNKGTNNYYIFEITSDPALFDGANDSDRSDDNFYATWRDDNAPNRLIDSSYPLPDDVWNRLNASDTLYFRIGTTSSETAWDDYTVSTSNADAQSAPHFTIQPAEATQPAEEPAASSDAPSVSGPDSMAASDDPPVFDVTTGSNPYYIFEITNDTALFDGANDGDRTDDNFYATWRDDSAPARLSDSSYTLPQDAWDHLKSSEKLYYRIGTTSSETSWDNYAVSTSDADAANAPSIETRPTRRASPPVATPTYKQKRAKNKAPKA